MGSILALFIILLAVTIQVQAQNTFAAIGSLAGGCNAHHAHAGPCENKQSALHRAADGVYQNDSIDRGDDHE